MDNETVSFYSRRILTEQGMVEGVLQVADGKFAGLIENPNPAQIAAARDFADQRIFAGIIDLHSHGYRSWSAKTIDKAEIQGLSKILPSIGVTATLATTSGWKAHEMEMLLSLIHISEPTRQAEISYAVFCLKKKKKTIRKKNKK